ncbi:MAG: chromosomal replication initiator protein DnaA [Marinifilaceae bacterium]|jgi:chromosomal replication initiator protein|nr:chromosomal replication initiator protein DnaA [Marinifilaceae bacterium]
MDSNHIHIWHNCLAVIKDNVPPVSFKTWFEPIVPINLEGNVLTLQVPSHFFYEYLEEQYIDILRKTLKREIGPKAKLEYSVLIDNTSAAKQMKPATVVMPANVNNNTSNKYNSNTKKESEGIANPFVIPGIQKIQIDSQLNPEYTLDNFVEGDCNRLARSAGAAVAENPGGTAFNPLVLYGDSGLGKTHLAQAIGLDAKQKNKEKSILYVSANKFQTQFTEAIRNNNKNDFLHFYQMIDVLIIDDIQELAGKEKTQNTFFHIFNHLHQTGKQLIITSDKPPVELKGMENRLLSRFKWGLSADLQNPDYDTRIHILKQKAYKDGISITDEVVEFLATHIVNNVRELEGALISLLAQSTLNKREINIELAAEIINKLVKPVSREISVSYIQKVVCEHFNLPVEVLQQKSRKREIVQARQIAMYFSKNLTKASLSSIGSQIGKKDHATVLHACKTVKNLKETNNDFRAQLNEIDKKLKV